MGMSAMKIIMSIINSDPPTLSGSGFSKEFKDFVSSCLQKDPAKRPTAEKLLKHKFLHKAEGAEYLVENFLAGIEDLKDRIGDKLQQEGKGTTFLPFQMSEFLQLPSFVNIEFLKALKKKHKKKKKSKKAKK
jgi:serine/threonine protein kinase